MKEIKTFDELWEAETKAWEDTTRLDLLYIRKAITCIDGYIIIVSADCMFKVKESIYYITNENFDKWQNGDKQYFKEKYNA